jgi:hypothetical protein
MLRSLRPARYNENQVRAAAGITMAAGTYAFVYAYFDKQFLPIKVVTTFFFVDFLIRVFGNLSHSPSGFVGSLLVRGRPPEWVSPEPKRFAWSIGLVMSFAMMVITNSGITGVLPRTICLICVTLMWLESVIGFCAGCYMYSIGVRRGWVQKKEGMVCAGGVCDIPAPASVEAEAAPTLEVVRSS